MFTEHSFDEHAGKVPGLKYAVGLDHYGDTNAYFAHLSDALLEMVRRETMASRKYRRMLLGFSRVGRH
jgi:hypothetical protein